MTQSGGGTTENQPFQSNRPPRRGGFENRGGFEGRDGPRESRGGGGGGGFREGGRGGKREFERRSGSDKRLARDVKMCEWANHVVSSYNQVR